MTPLTSFRWKTGHDQVLLDLTYIENDLAPYFAPKPVPVSSQPVNLFPIQELTADGVMVGYGFPAIRWDIGIGTYAALNYVITNWCNSDGSGKATTINSRRHDVLTYARYNVYLSYPVPGVHYTKRPGRIEGWFLEFTGAIAL